MQEHEYVGKVFARYYAIPHDLSAEPTITVIRIVGVDEISKSGEVVRFKTVALRDDRRPKRVGPKERTISLQTLENYWVMAPEDTTLTDKQVYEDSIKRAADFLSQTANIPESQALALATIISEMVNSADKRRIARANAVLGEAQKELEPTRELLTAVLTNVYGAKQ